MGDPHRADPPRREQQAGLEHVQAVHRRALSLSGLGPPTARALALCAAAAVAALVAATLTEAPLAVERAFQLVLVASFVGLAVVDLRLAVGFLIVEVALGGAGGQWTQFPAGVSGRNFLTAVVVARAAVDLFLRHRRTGGLDLGPYVPHALGVAVVVGFGWMALGLLNDNGRSNVTGDGNGVLFLAFALPLALLVQTGSGAWLRKCLLVAAAANAVLTAIFIVLGLTRIAPFRGTLGKYLLEDLDFGGNIGFLLEGSFRLYLGSGLYLPVGLALVTWYLKDGRGNRWLWALYALLWFDVGASYTRGFWLTSVLGVAVVLVLGSPGVKLTWRRVAPFAAVVPVMFALLIVVGFSEPKAILNRATTIGETPRSNSREAKDLLADVRAGRLSAAAVSDEIRRRQAEVLTDHIKERPLIGHGFGAIAKDYEFGQIYSYELTYLDIGYKTGIIGLLLFLSFPLRLLFDAIRTRLGRRDGAEGVTAAMASVPIAFISILLLLSGTNPYLLAAFGLSPIILGLAWLEPSRRD